MHYFVTGGAGFIGSNLVDRLLLDGHRVTAYDNFSTGRREFLLRALKHSAFTLLEGDLGDRRCLADAMAGSDCVIHLAANADVRLGTTQPTCDLEQNTAGTSNVLEAMRANGLRRIAFASSGSVYGEPALFPTPEDAPYPVQTSLYGASKQAAEGLITAYCAGFGFQCWIFRFVSVLGARYSHGHIYDFYKRLLTDTTRITLLGDGKQRKSYLDVEDCLDAVILAMTQAQDQVNVFNVGTDEYCSVDNSLDWICDELGLSPVREYTGGERGWPGDSPFIFLDCARVRGIGWRPRVTIREGVLRTLAYLQQNRWLLEVRP